MSKLCPSCNAPLELGSLTLDRTFVGWLMGGAFYPHLFFQKAGAPRHSILSWKDKDPPAWHCAKCCTVVFPGRRR